MTTGFNLKMNSSDIANEMDTEGCIQSVSYTHLRAPRDATLSRMPSSA